MTPTLIDLQNEIEAKSAALDLLTAKADPSPEDADAADVIADEIKAAQVTLDAREKARTRMAAQRQTVVDTNAYLNEPASAVPFKGRIDVGAQQEDKTKHVSDWLKCVGILGSHKSSPGDAEFAAKRLEKVYKSAFKSWASVKAALSEQTGISGGYLAPPEYSNELLSYGIEDTVLASKAKRLTMGSAELHIPALDQTSTNAAGQTNFTGGMVAYWTGEAATRTEIEPKFKQVTLRANELSGYTVASRNILADSGNTLETMLQMLIRDSISWYIDYACLQGNGVFKPLGVLNAPATITVNRATANNIKLADATSMMKKLLPKSRKNAIWLAAIDTFDQIATLVNAAGTPTYINNVGTGYDKAPLFADTLPLLGRPLYFTEKLPALGTKGDLMLVDPSFYLLGMRQELEIAASDAPGFTKNQMYWRFVARVDGQPWLDQPYTLQDQVRQVSPFVALV